MELADALSRGHEAVINVIDEIPEADRDTPGVVGEWSVREIIAHLASHEEVLAEILTTTSRSEIFPGYPG